MPFKFKLVALLTIVATCSFLALSAFRRQTRSAIESKEKFIVLIFGGAHAEGLSKRFVEKGYETTVLEPVGYDSEAEEWSRKILKVLPNIDEILKK